MGLNESVANNCAMLNTYEYLNFQDDKKTKEHTLKSIVNNPDCIEEIKKINADDKVDDELNLLQSACENESYGNLILVNQSHIDYGNYFEYSGENCLSDPIQACAFVEGDVSCPTRLYISYRGTGKKRWGDNGQGFVDESTDMQRAAQEYFDFVVEQYPSCKEIYVTGHSKGGNEAQYVMMTSKYRDRITGCYSVEGQGFSKAAIKKFKEMNQNGEYENLLQKMYSINSSYDPVHALCNIIISDENTFYVDTDFKATGNFSFFYCHNILGIVSPDGVRWIKKERNIQHGEESVLVSFVRTLMVKLDSYSVEEQRAMAVGIMCLIDYWIYEGSMDDAGFTTNDISIIKEELPSLLLETYVEFEMEIIRDKIFNVILEKLNKAFSALKSIKEIQSKIMSNIILSNYEKEILSLYKKYKRWYKEYQIKRFVLFNSKCYINNIEMSYIKKIEVLSEKSFNGISCTEKLSGYNALLNGTY